jgi:hypothetical protein
MLFSHRDPNLLKAWAVGTANAEKIRPHARCLFFASAQNADELGATCTARAHPLQTAAPCSRRSMNQAMNWGIDMRYRYAATMVAGVLMIVAAAHAQDGGNRGKLVAIGNGATTPLCKRLAAIADSYSGASAGPAMVRAIPEQQLSPPFARIWSPALPVQLTPELIRHIAADRFRLDAQQELDALKPLTSPGTTVPGKTYDTRAEEIGVPRLRAAITEGKLVVERATVDVTGGGKPSTAVHIGIRTDAQQAYHLIDWSVHLVPDAHVSQEEPNKPSIINLLRDAAPPRLSDIVRYGGKDYFTSASMGARHVRMQGTTASVATVCEGAARLADGAAKR